MCVDDVLRSSLRAAATLNIKEKKRGDVAVICQRIQKRTLFEDKIFTKIYKNKPDCPNKTPFFSSLFTCFNLLLLPFEKRPGVSPLLTAG